MTILTSKVASAFLIGALAGVLLTVEAAPLHAADTCLSGPKGAAPTGSHWHYRTDHAAKRNCWYVRAESGQSKSANASGTPALPQAKAPLQPSVANARAEAAPADIWQSNRVAAESVPSASENNDPVSNPPAADNGRATLAARGLEQTISDTVTASTPQADVSVANLKSPTPPVAAMPSAAEKRPPASGRVPIQLIEIVGALVIAAIFGSIIFKFGSGRNDRRHSGQRDQRAPWDSIDVGASIQPLPLATKASTPTSFARDDYEPMIPDEIVQLLARLSKEAAA